MRKLILKLFFKDAYEALIYSECIKENLCFLRWYYWGVDDNIHKVVTILEKELINNNIVFQG